MTFSLIFYVRLAAMFCATMTLGMGGVLLYRYLTAPVRTPRKVHVILMGFSYEVWVTGGIWHVMDKVLNKEPWEFHSSPLVFAASLLGMLGLMRFIESRKPIKVVG